MADIEQFTEEQAQKLLEETYTNNGNPPATDVVESTPALEEAPAETTTEVAEATDTATPVETAAPVEDANNPYSWVDSIPDEALRNKVVEQIQAKLQADHAAKSQTGRAKALQQKLLESERRISTSRPQGKPAAPAEPATLTTPEGWLNLAKNDPELAEAIEARVKSEINAAVGSVRGELQELRQTHIIPQEERNREQYVEHERQQLKALVPNYEQVVNSREYANWLENHASNSTRHMAMTSNDHRDAIAALQLYANDMVALGYYKPPVSAAPVSAAATTTEQADKIAASRAAKASATVVIPSAPLAPVASSKTGPINAEDAQKILEDTWNKILAKKT